MSPSVEPLVDELVNGGSVGEGSLVQAQLLDRNDPMHHLREEFIIPLKGGLKAKSNANQPTDLEESVYLCGNSLGVQPRSVRAHVAAQLNMWENKGVFGHHKGGTEMAPTWGSIDEEISIPMSKIVGASPEEVAVMGTLTANLHLLMASFYKPTAERYKIIFESKAFPSDHFAVESQIQHHGRSLEEAMVCIEPSDKDRHWFSADDIYSTIDRHAASTAVLMLPGIHYYSGQLFDMQTITAYAKSKGIIVGWDLAHAAGNVPVKLHDWDVDFAVWCNYKYINGGPGAVGGLFVHSKHTNTADFHVSRLKGWWGSSKASRFNMDNQYEPIPGAKGFQLSNPSALDFCPLRASLAVFSKTNMTELRNRSLKLTGYLERLLLANTESRNYEIITGKDRGAQLSIKLSPGLLNDVFQTLEENGVVVDKRKPDVIRVAPTPLYNSYLDCWLFVHVFSDAVEKAVASKRP